MNFWFQKLTQIKKLATLRKEMKAKSLKARKSNPKRIAKLDARKKKKNEQKKARTALATTSRKAKKAPAKK